MRVMIPSPPFNTLPPKQDWRWQKMGIWPCKWVSPAGDPAASGVWAYRLNFEQAKSSTIHAHVSADERYELFLDGERIGRGSERGDLNRWYFESYDIPLSTGKHVLVAKVWSQGSQAPFAQIGLRPGFIFAVEGPEMERLSTGHAAWQVKKLGGIRFRDNPLGWGVGCTIEIDAATYDWGFEKGGGEGWEKAVSKDGDEGCDGRLRNENWPTRKMQPAMLPAMFESSFKAGPFPATIPAGNESTFLIDLKDYYCAYPSLLLSGGKGSKVELLWAESLYNEPEFRTKGNRNEVEGKHFNGFGDACLPDGTQNRRFENLWWRAGRYLQLKVKTAGEALEIQELGLRECRYPLSMEGKFSSSDPRLERFIPIGLRGMQMCSHETYVDCPYYEQLMYVGDTRLECLVTHCLTSDSRLPKKALATYDISRLNNALGLTQSRHPSRIQQIIPPFSLWWVAMAHDFALWRGDKPFIQSLLPGIRGVLDAFSGWLNKEGLLEGPIGWNYMDWVPGWAAGVPPQGEFGVSCLMNWHFAYVLERAAQLEEWCGAAEIASLQRRRAGELSARLVKKFWDPKRALFKDAPGYCEHSQCLALLSGHLPAAQAKALAKSLPKAKGLSRTTIYFSHYLFESFAKLGRMDLLHQRLELWHEHETLGLKTPVEAPEPTRSDCHAWGSHPIYHYYATILGIRPASFGFDTVRIQPQLGPLTHAKGRMPHPKGFIEVEFEMKKGKLSGKVKLPKGVKGELLMNGVKKRI